MTLLSNEDQNKIRHMFEEMTSAVKIVFFADSRPDGCQYCEDARQILEEVAGLSPKIAVEPHDIGAEPEIAALYGVDKTPAMAFVQVSEADQASKDFGLRFYGIPSGYESMTLLEDIVMVSKGESKISPTTQAWLSTLTRPVRLQVFVTPTCPYCPQMVSLAHRLAIASPLVQAEGIEATEYPELADKYGVYGVPRTVISAEGAKDQHIEGAVPEAKLLVALQKTVGSTLIIASH